jgi:NitT/TauT family transport system ATP-binding protein
LRIVCGLIPATRGKVLIGGTAVRGPRRDVGVVFQNPVLLPWLTVKDNVLMPMDLRHRRRREDDKRARLLLAMAGLTGFETKYPFELSGGMRQRVSICRALMCEPSFLAMDEPFGALDAMTRETMNLELMRICRDTGATVLFITHSVPEAVLMSDRVLVMTPRPGRVVDDIGIAIDRPRSLTDYGLETFNAYTSRIRKLLGAETCLIDRPRAMEPGRDAVVPVAARHACRRPYRLGSRDRLLQAAARNHSAAAGRDGRALGRPA